MWSHVVELHTNSSDVIRSMQLWAFVMQALLQNNSVFSNHILWRNIKLAMQLEQNEQSILKYQLLRRLKGGGLGILIPINGTDPKFQWKSPIGFHIGLFYNRNSLL